MSPRLFRLCLIIFISCISLGEVHADQILVKVDGVLGFEEARDVARQFAASINGQIVGEFEYINLFQIETPNETPNEIMGDIIAAKNYPSIVLAFPDQQLYHR